MRSQIFVWGILFLLVKDKIIKFLLSIGRFIFKHIALRENCKTGNISGLLCLSDVNKATNVNNLIQTINMTLDPIQLGCLKKYDPKVALLL